VIAILKIVNKEHCQFKREQQNRNDALPVRKLIFMLLFTRSRRLSVSPSDKGNTI